MAPSSTQTIGIVVVVCLNKSRQVGYANALASNTGNLQGQLTESVFNILTANTLILGDGGVGILSPTDSAQVVDSIKREKRQKQRIRSSGVHRGYTEVASAYRSRTSLPEPMPHSHFSGEAELLFAKRLMDQT